jgi:hypothetical protein
VRFFNLISAARKGRRERSARKIENPCLKYLFSSIPLGQRGLAKNSCAFGRPGAQRRRYMGGPLCFRDVAIKESCACNGAAGGAWDATECNVMQHFSRMVRMPPRTSPATRVPRQARTVMRKDGSSMSSVSASFTTTLLLGGCVFFALNRASWRTLALHSAPLRTGEFHLKKRSQMRTSRIDLQRTADSTGCNSPCTSRVPWRSTTFRCVPRRTSACDLKNRTQNACGGARVPQMETQNVRANFHRSRLLELPAVLR